LWSRGQRPEVVSANKNTLKYRPLSDCWKEFLNPSDFLDEEVELVKEWENSQFTELNHPLKKRPVERMACKSVALEVKYLLKLRDEMTTRTMKLATDFVTLHISEHVASDYGAPDYDKVIFKSCSFHKEKFVRRININYCIYFIWAFRVLRWPFLLV